MKKKLLLTIIIVFAIIAISLIYFFIMNKNLKDEKSAIKLYKNLIDTIASKYSTFQDEFISISFDNVLDPLSKEKLSNDAKKEIINYTKKYNSVIYDKAKEDLINENNEHTNKLFISFSYTSFSYKKATINVYYYISNQSSGMQSFKIKYTKDAWNISKINYEVIS